jgi:hypothetical protein
LISFAFGLVMLFSKVTGYLRRIDIDNGDEVQVAPSPFVAVASRAAGPTAPARIDNGIDRRIAKVESCPKRTGSSRRSVPQPTPLHVRGSESLAYIGGLVEDRLQLEVFRQACGLRQRLLMPSAIAIVLAPLCLNTPI